MLRQAFYALFFLCANASFHFAKLGFKTAVKFYTGNIRPSCLSSVSFIDIDIMIMIHELNEFRDTPKLCTQHARNEK